LFAETKRDLGRWKLNVPGEAKRVEKTKYYFLDRAAYMRGLAQEAETPQLRSSCLKAAAEYEALAEKAVKASDNLQGRAQP